MFYKFTAEFSCHWIELDTSYDVGFDHQTCHKLAVIQESDNVLIRIYH